MTPTTQIYNSHYPGDPPLVYNSHYPKPFQILKNKSLHRYAASLGSGPESKLGAMLAPFDPNPLAVDLLKRTLAFNPTKRVTAADCLQNMYFSEVSFPACCVG